MDHHFGPGFAKEPLRTVPSLAGLKLPAAANATVSFNSFSGDLKSDVPLTLRSSSRRSFTAELGSGGDSRLRFKTFSGDVRINR